MAKPFYDSDIAWCPGCGDFGILNALNRTLDAMQFDRRRLVLVSGIGQAAKLPHYMKANVFNGLHGRAVPAATAIKIANHELEVIITSGDGDMYGEGGNHFLHGIRRNVGVKAIVCNNQVYGLTKGQASPTSDLGFTTKVQSHGVVAKPFNPLGIAVIEDCSFVARSFSADMPHLTAMMKAAIEHKGGFALLDVLQPCVTFNKVNTYKWYRERVRPVDAAHDPYDRDAALKLAEMWGDDGIPIGIIYKSRRPSFELQIAVLQRGTLVGRYVEPATDEVR